MTGSFLFTGQFGTRLLLNFAQVWYTGPGGTPITIADEGKVVKGGVPKMVIEGSEPRLVIEGGVPFLIIRGGN